MPIKAKDLLTTRSVPMPSRDALAELKLILAHNDAIGHYHLPGWVSQSSTRELLASWRYPCGKDGLQKLCRQLGRKGYNHA